MLNVEYPKLNRVQKTAVFLIVIGQEAAARIVRSFTDTELEAVCREMTRLPVIDNACQRAALEEFAHLIDLGYDAALGGTSYVRGTLEKARGEHRAASFLERVAPAAAGEGGGTALQQFEGMDTRQVFSLLKGEQPQTIAFLLSQFDVNKAGAIVRMLEPEQRAVVLERLGEMESTSPEVVRRIALQLNRRSAPSKSAAPAAPQATGGAPFVASLLKTLDKETSRSLLGVLHDRNAALSDVIRKKLFGFEDIGKLAVSDIQRIMRDVETADLATSLKGPRGDEMLKKFATAMSRRAAEALNDEIQMLPSIRPKELEAAQDRVLAVVRRLEEKGEISLDVGEVANAA